MKRKNRQDGLIRISQVVIALLIFGLGIAFSEAYSHSKIPSDISRDNEHQELFWKVWNLLEERYPFDEPTSDTKFYGAISGLAESYGDDYTSFFPPQDAQYFNETVSGEFGGIGAEITLEQGYLVVVAPLENSPAQASGLKPTDIIMKVDGDKVSGMTLNEAISRIRGEVGTTVTLSVLREGNEDLRDIEITRDIVTIPVIETEVIDGVFVIHLFNFNEKSSDEFSEAITEFKNSNSQKLLIDLRNNPGGYLEASIDIASYFVPQGKIVVTEDFGNNGMENEHHRSSGHTLLKNKGYEMAVLINHGSASASEILAAALQDHDIATVLGERSFGKGSVQELIQLPQDTALKVTVAKWLTPDGNMINEEGVDPDMVIESPEEGSSQDIQLQEAVDYLNDTNNS